MDEQCINDMELENTNNNSLRDDVGPDEDPDAGHGGNSGTDTANIHDDDSGIPEAASETLFAFSTIFTFAACMYMLYIAGFFRWFVEKLFGDVEMPSTYISKVLMFLVLVFNLATVVIEFLSRKDTENLAFGFTAIGYSLIVFFLFILLLVGSDKA